MGAYCPLGSLVSRPDGGVVFDVFHLSGRGVDIAADDEHYRATQQRI
jgi:hypothetical protein